MALADQRVPAPTGGPTPAMARDTGVTADILRNARAAERERLRNIAIRNNPSASSDEIDAIVRELELEKLSKAGRAGRASQQRMAELGRQYYEAHPELVAALAELRDDCDNVLAKVNAITIRDGEAA